MDRDRRGIIQSPSDSASNPTMVSMVSRLRFSFPGAWVPHLQRPGWSQQCDYASELRTSTSIPWHCFPVPTPCSVLSFSNILLHSLLFPQSSSSYISHLPSPLLPSLSFPEPLCSSCKPRGAGLLTPHPHALVCLSASRPLFFLLSYKPPL